MIPASRLAPRLTARFGSRNVCATGLVLMAAGVAIVAQVGTNTPYGLMAARLAVLGIAVLGSILAATYSSNLNVSGLPSQVASQVKNSFATAPQLAAPIPGRASSAFVDAMHVALLTASGAVLLAAVGVVVLLAGGSRRSSANEPEEAVAAAAARPSPRAPELGNR